MYDVKFRSICISMYLTIFFWNNLPIFKLVRILHWIHLLYIFSFYYTVTRCPQLTLPAHSYLTTSCPNNYGATCPLQCQDGYKAASQSGPLQASCDLATDNTPGWTVSINCQGLRFFHWILTFCFYLLLLPIVDKFLCKNQFQHWQIFSFVSSDLRMNTSPQVMS